jgi:hypothetical protein
MGALHSIVNFPEPRCGGAFRVVQGEQAELGHEVDLRGGVARTGAADEVAWMGSGVGDRGGR